MYLPIIVILGPTASGKTSLAVKLAQQCGGEIICADSRTVYKGMDIGTAKPSEVERGGIAHHGLDLVEPDQRFTLYDFQQYALAKIAEIRSRQHVPLLVGGSGLYIDSIVHSYGLQPGGFDATERAKLEKLSVPMLKQLIAHRGLTLPRDASNPRRLIRTLELGGKQPQRQPRRSDAIVFGISTPLAELKQRMLGRAQAMLQLGLVEETKMLLNKYGMQEPLRRNAYGVVQRFLQNELAPQDLAAELARCDYQLARKQLTFWRSPLRADDICWQNLAQFNELLDRGLTVSRLVELYQALI